MMIAQSPYRSDFNETRSTGCMCWCGGCNCPTGECRRKSYTTIVLNLGVDGGAPEQLFVQGDFDPWVYDFHRIPLPVEMAVADLPTRRLLPQREQHRRWREWCRRPLGRLSQSQRQVGEQRAG